MSENKKAKVKVLYPPLLTYQQWAGNIASAVKRCDPNLPIYIQHATEVSEKISDDLPTSLKKGKISEKQFVTLSTQYYDISDKIKKMLWDFSEKCVCKIR